MSDTTEDKPIVRVTDYAEAFVRDTEPEFTAERPSPGTIHLYPKHDHPKGDEELYAIADSLGDALVDRFDEDITAERLPDGPIEVVVEAEA